MNWPNHTDYQDAIQNPNICLLEDELKAATVRCDMLGMPRVMSGNFASVYELITQNNKRHAIRCFVRQVANQQTRYNLLTRHLQTISLEWLVGFEFHLRGIRVRNDWYPIVKMDWVDGVPMHIYVEEHVKEPETMLRLAKSWRDLLHGLRQAQIAHGDLQHGNVMCLADGSFRLVDYDGMYVPAFGQGRSPELGHANYQHPRRTPDYYDINLDNFAALVIYTSFLALAKEPDLWQKFHTGDNLILLSNDFKDPRNSKVFQRLKQSPDPDVQKLTAVIERACIWPIAQVPQFDDTLKALASGTLPEPAVLPAVTSAVPEWLSAIEPEVGTRGTRPAGARPGTRPAPGLESGVAPGKPGTRPAATKPATRPAPARTGTRPAGTGTRPTAQAQPASTASPVVASRGPVKAPEAAPPLNYFALASVAIAIASFIPHMHWFGLLAVICGVIGWMQLQQYNSPLKWVALVAMVVGGGTFAVGIIKHFNRPGPVNPPRGQLDLAPQKSRALAQRFWRAAGPFPNLPPRWRS